uniref:Uncharacterized protein n=1 Tax=Rhizophora mucronata TaxID=61149 RepID=A0A2P2JW31_RHIMU
MSHEYMSMIHPLPEEKRGKTKSRGPKEVPRNEKWNHDSEPYLLAFELHDHAKKRSKLYQRKAMNLTITGSRSSDKILKTI